MRTFYDAATQHYIRSSQMFHSSANLVRCPGMLMFSKRDPIGTPDSNMRVRDNWDALGIKVILFYSVRISLSLYMLLKIYICGKHGERQRRLTIDISQKLIDVYV